MPRLVASSLFALALSLPVLAQPELDLLDLGGGGLSLSVTGIPGGTVEGWTLLSFNTSLPLGAGPIAGLGIDFNTLIGIVTSAPVATPGSPFHWTHPAPGLFPDQPFLLPPGSLPIGLSFDALAIANGAGGQTLGISAPDRVTLSATPAFSIGAVTPSSGAPGGMINALLAGLPIGGLGPQDLCMAIKDANGNPLAFIRPTAVNGQMVTGMVRSLIGGGGQGRIEVMTGSGVVSNVAPPAGWSFLSPSVTWKETPSSVGAMTSTQFTVNNTTTGAPCPTTGSAGCVSHQFQYTPGSQSTTINLGSASCPPNAKICFELHVWGNCAFHIDQYAELQNGNVTISAQDCAARLAQAINAIFTNALGGGPIPFVFPVLLNPQTGAWGLQVLAPAGCTWTNVFGHVLICP